MSSYHTNKRKPNPRQNANFISAATYFYTIPTFFRANKEEFDENSIYEILKQYQSAVLGKKLEAVWNSELKSAYGANRSPSLRKVLFRSFGFEVFLWGLLLACVECLSKPTLALLVGRLVSLYTFNSGSYSYVVEYSIAVALLAIFNVALWHPFAGNVYLLGLKAKIACSSLIFRKALRLNHSALNKTSVGQVVNLLASDVVTLIRCFFMINRLWVDPMQCLIITYLMYQEVGFSAIIGVLLLLLFIPFYFFLAKKTSKYRSKTVQRSDERIHVMNEVISGIQVIKMYVWEKPIADLVASLRNMERKWIKLSTNIKAIYLTVDVALIPILLYATIIVYVQKNQITADKVFSLTIFYNTLRLSMGFFFPQALSFVAETLVSIDRINAFLINSEVNLQNVRNTDDSVDVKITGGVAKWDADVILRDINLTISRGSLVAIIGQVGCGKSSLVNVILKELPLISGEIVVNGKVSYASQVPWLFVGSVRDNILFGEQMDSARYNEVIRRCALECDFNLLPFGDGTIVGGRGASLSGGQKARINLARAIYRDADIYLLDDPFSAVDVRVGKHIFQEGIKTFLKGKTTLLVTNHLHYLKDVDEIIALDGGTIKSSEKWEDNYVFNSAQDNSENTSIFPEDFTSADKVQEVVTEQRSQGSISRRIYATYFTLGGNVVLNSVVVGLLLLSQALLSSGPCFLTYWVNIPKYEKITVANASNIIQFDEGFKEMNTYIYSIITLSFVIITSIRSHLFYSICLKSSKKLHDNMLNSILRATISFFNTNSQGRIINRFSQDMEIVDAQLPNVAFSVIQLTLGLFASALLVTFVNYWLLIPIVVIVTIIYYIQAFCLKTIRNMKRLESVTRSPVLEHLSSSLQGLDTIRAFSAEEILRKEFDSHQDLHNTCNELVISTVQAFGASLDYMSSIYVAIVTLTFLTSDGILGGNIGLAITQCLQVTNYLQWTVRQAAELGNLMTSAERILEYNTIGHEEQWDEKKTTVWPNKGEIVFSNVSMRYSLQDPPALKNLNFSIVPKEKIGIVGRTGAGKSSIVNALFRLSHPSGNILIDNVDTKEINLQELRSKISIIPQSSVLFSGTLRSNLDPFEEYEDSELWSALDDVELKEFFSELPLGLDHVINQSGSNVSVGQRQLICLARVILRSNKILVLDEATASIDFETDRLVQRAIRIRFADCTVITIAHRVGTVMDCDRVMVMSAGEVIELDAPSVLLQNVNGYFYQMVQQARREEKSSK